MLDEFIRVAYEADRNRDRSVKLAADMGVLPISELQHIVKHGMLDGDGRWIDKYKGTPLFDRAAQIEQASLELQMQRDQADQEDRSQRDARSEQSDMLHAARDQICVQKKLMDLELDKVQNQVMSGGPPAPPIPAEAVKVASARMRAKLASLRAPDASYVAFAREKMAEAAAVMARRDMEKESAVKAPGFLSNVGDALSKAKGVFDVGRTKGLYRGARRAGYKATGPGTMAGLKNVAAYGADWAKKNPLHAAGAAAGAAGLGAGVGGLALGAGGGYLAGKD